MILAGLAAYSNLSPLDQLGETLVLRGISGDGSSVIIKTHASDLPTTDMRERLRREHDITARATHPHLVGVRDLIDQPTRTALVLDDPGDSTFADLVEAGKLDLFDVLDIGIEIGTALAAMHVAGGVHRAVDAHRIVLTATNGAVLVDFYDGALAGSRPRRDTQGAFPAPEQVAVEPPPAEPATDQFALASTIRGALTAAGLTAPDGLASILDLASNPNPRQRYRSILGMVKDLTTARQRLVEDGSCPAFDLEPFGPNLRWEDPTELFGRAALLDELHSHIEAVATNHIGRVVVLRGEPGLGRTSVVMALCDQLAERGVLSGLGRFYDDGPALPLQAPLDMMDQVVGLLLAGPEATLNRLGDELVARLGEDLALATQVIPALEHLVGSQPESQFPQPEQAISRVEHAVRAAVRTIAQCQPPFVAVFDDGDRADASSLKTLEMLGGHPDVGPLVAVVTTRPDPGRLAPAFKRLRATGSDIIEIDLAALDRRAVRDLVARGTGSDANQIALVADAIWARSGGSPTLVLADIWRLTSGGHLFFDLDTGEWTWDAIAIEQDEVATIDTVAQRRVEHLDPELRNVVVAVAVAGRSATTQVLSHWSGATTETMSGLVDRGIAARVLSRAATDAEAGIERITCVDNGIRRAALQALDPDQVDATRYALARAIIATAPVGTDGLVRPDDQDRFTLIGLLDGQPSLQTDPDDAALFARLCIDAARAAHLGAGFREALQLQLAAIAVLPSNAWASDPDGTFRLHLHAAEHALMLGDSDTVDDLLDRLDLPTRSTAHRVRALRLLGGRAWKDDEPGIALASLRRILAELGEPVPENVGWSDVAREYVKARRAIGTVDPSTFLTADRLDDERVGAALDAMIACVHLAYIDQPMTHLWLVLRGTQLTARHGVSDASAYFLTAYGMLSLSLPLGIGTGLEFGRVGRELGRSAAGGVPQVVEFAHNAFVRHWGEPLGVTIDPLLAAFRQSVANQQREYGLASGTFAVLHGLLASRPLRTVDADAEECIADLEQMGEHGYATRVRIVRQALHDLRSGPSESILDGPEFSTSEWMANKSRTGELAMIVHTVRALVAMCFADRETMLAATAAADPLTRTAPGQAALGRHWFHVAYLDAEAVGLATSRVERARRRVLAERSLLRLRRLARHAPTNANHRVALVEAVLSETSNRSDGHAMDRYEEAVSLATSNGALHDLGIAAERAARFHAGLDHPALARHYGQIARDAWESWGATALAETVEARLPDSVVLHARLRADSSDADGSDDENAPTDSTSETLAEASSLFGQELEVRDFLERLIEILLRHTGATRGFLVLQSDDGPRVEVAGHQFGDTIQVTPVTSADFADHDELCVPAVNYVLRTRQVLSLVDPASDRRFRADPNLRARAPRSMLCLPVGRSNATNGVLVLESDTYSHAFETERIEALRILSAQAISAVDQARLSSDLTILTGDLAELRATASELTTKAETDALTGVANRAGMESSLGAAIRAAHQPAGDRRMGRDEAQVGVLFCDLDDFKAVNDQFGHAVGDAVLTEIAARLKSVTRTDDIVARIGGDEFVVVSVGVSHDELEVMADRALSEIARDIDVPPHGAISVSISIGVGRADLGDIMSIADVDALVLAADHAMYDAKSSGKNQVQRGSHGQATAD